jgi:hypothetical protein
VPTIFLVASIPLVHPSPLLVRLLERTPGDIGTDLRDRWCATPNVPERDALLDRLLDWQQARPRRQVAVLSGDVHAGAAFRVGRSHGPGWLWQWTSSPLTTPLDAEVRIANWVSTALAPLGQRRYRVRREALVLLNNFGTVDVEPLAGGGHRLTFTLHAYRWGDAGTRVAARVWSSPPGVAAG